MRIRNRKGAEEQSNFGLIISLILVAIVLVLLVLFVLKIDIVGWVKGLPGYNYNPEDKLIDFTSMPDAVKKELCVNGIVGQIGPPEGGSWYKSGIQYIYFYYRDSSGKEINQKSDLYWVGDEVNAKIKLDKSGKDVIVASVTNYKIIVEKTASDTGFISRLQNAYSARNNYICKYEIEKSDTVTN